MWYVHNNEVVVFMHDSQQEIDAEIVKTFFPQSYTQGQCYLHFSVDTNVPFILSTGERVDGENPRGETQLRIRLRREFFERLFPLKRNRRVVSIIALISPVYGTDLVIDDGKTTKNVHAVSEQTLFRIMGLCSRSTKYEISHRYNAGTNPNLLYDGATFNLIITRKTQTGTK